MTNDIPAWVPSVEDMREAARKAWESSAEKYWYIPSERCLEAIRALVASRLPKVREVKYTEAEANHCDRALSYATPRWLPEVSELEVAATRHGWWGVCKAIGRAFDKHEKERTPARESVDVEPSISEMRAAYYKAIGSSTVNGSSPTPSLDAGMAALRSLCRSRTTAPPRDSSPAASGEEPFAPKSKNALRMTMEFRPEMTDLEKAVAGFEAAREFDKLVMARWTRKSAKFTAPDEAAKPIFDALVDAYEKGVADHVARDSSAAESGRVTEPWHVDVRVQAILAAAVRGENDSPLACEIKRLHGKIDDIGVRVSKIEKPPKSNWEAICDGVKEHLAQPAPPTPPTPAAPEATFQGYAEPCSYCGKTMIETSATVHCPDSACQGGVASAPISTDEGEMKACPFCGKKPTLDHDMVYCRDRGCPGYDADAPIAAWNRRAPAPEAERLRDLLRTVEERVQVRPCGTGWQVWLVVGVQSFRVNDCMEDENETTGKEHAEWMASMLRKALTALLALARGEESEGGK